MSLEEVGVVGIPRSSVVGSRVQNDRGGNDVEAGWGGSSGSCGHLEGALDCANLTGYWWKAW